MPFKILRTESEADLADLQAEIAEDFHPTDVIERELVEEIVDYTWKIRRYRRVATGIQNNALRKALAQILNEILLPPSATTFVKCWIASQRLSHSWLLDPEGRRRVESLLEEAGRDLSAIEAQAHTLVADDVENANRMEESARAGRDKALRSLARYRKSLAVQLRRNSDRVLVADQAPLIAGSEEN